MSSRRSTRSGRTCLRIGHVAISEDLHVCRRCRCQLEPGRPVRKNRYGFRLVWSGRGPWALRLFRYVWTGPRQRAKCHDCAFRPMSGERICPNTWPRVLHGVSAHVPFFCHQGMPVDEHNRYAPANDRRGLPAGAKLCGGWYAEHRFYHGLGDGLHSPSVEVTAAEHIAAIRMQEAIEAGIDPDVARVGVAQLTREGRLP